MKRIQLSTDPTDASLNTDAYQPVFTTAPIDTKLTATARTVQLTTSQEYSMANEREITVKESPVAMIEGETITFSLTWLGATTVSGSTATVYKNKTDYSSTAMPSGSHSENGNVSTFKPLAAQDGDGGGQYIVIFQATVDNNIERRKLVVDVVKDEE